MYLLLGVVVLLSPVVITQVKNVEQAQIGRAYSRDVARLDNRQRLELLRQAREYNATLGGGGLRDPWGEPHNMNDPAYRRYLSLLNTNQTMARLRVPSVGIDLPVRHGTSQRVLASGVGHLYGSALPVGGVGTHTVLTGHTGLATLTMFDNLTHIKSGDVFIIEVAGEQLAYKVNRIEVVTPDKLDEVRPVPGHDYATLVTCTPYGINSHRLLVRGERLAAVPTNLPQDYHSPWQPWMVAVIVVSLLVLIYLLWWLFGAHRRRQPKKAQPTQPVRPRTGARPTQLVRPKAGAQTTSAPARQAPQPEHPEQPTSVR